ncbi:hypothetical protein [Synechococcus sp. MIT S1220]|uniref:hypothetical protein n=1 Tax=Synechococcus sp. MIT S1220 TaxID=3082549 RepID=UPI0039AFCAA2
MKSDADVVYDTKKGKLYLNANGEEKGWGKKKVGGLIARFKGKPELSADHFDGLTAHESDSVISRVIFPGNGEFDEGLYQMQDGTLLFAEPDLDPGDSPFNDEVIYGKDGKPLDIPNVVGIYPIRSGFSLVQVDDKGKYIEQGFKYGRKGPQPFGKPRKIKSIDKTEKRIQFDINNDQKIAGQQVGGSGDAFSDGPSLRSINPIDAEALIDPLA